jgi:hypothetical protein
MREQARSFCRKRQKDVAGKRKKRHSRDRQKYRNGITETGKSAGTEGRNHGYQNRDGS